ncbi:phosphotransferase [Paenibacillus sp. BSR1-1]|uniref:aminoglycoside phosphotransferase family protein n=1 Tax=Paenibacillus sp. BSR1-1 TaxID=3020845 RepID=UPI0025B1F453|nr:phosphotransferase [Paenibacillus sp. BSR1-1]MDN3015213.1 phosphotransferase [Paenibacillus sp. BSR1-1]
MILSDINSQQYELLKEECSFWDQKIAEILIQEKLPLTGIRKFHYGANIVYSFGGNQFVIKLFPKHLNEQYTRELEVLTILEGKIKIVDTPKLVNHGSFEGWNYLIMTQLQGELLIDIWDRLTNEEQENLSKDLGKTIKEFHEVPITGLKQLPSNWNGFIQKQFKNMKHYHQNMELNSNLYSDLDLYVEEKYINTNPENKLLTGEYTPFNLLLNNRNGNWKLTGVIDFADCFLGDGDYDLLGPIMFMFNSNQKLIKHFLESYGFPKIEVNHVLQKKLMTYTILHRFSDINYFASQNQEAKLAANFNELARILIPIS